MMIDLFISKEISNGNIKKSFKSVSDHLLIHGHFHLKALYGTADVKSIINTSSSTCANIPSGCFGMAGSFGYEKEHYDISEKIGNEILFPAVKAILQ